MNSSPLNAAPDAVIKRQTDKDPPNPCSGAIPARRTKPVLTLCLAQLFLTPFSAIFTRSQVLWTHLGHTTKGGNGGKVTPCHTHLVIDTLNLIQQTLGAQSFGVILLEVDCLVVQGFQIGLLILLPPNLVEALLGLPPFFLFCFQSA